MTSGSFRFDRYILDPQDRRLRRGDATVALNARYMDALILLVRERGKLVTKDRFLEEVWRGVPVTDEALTQCIRVLRRRLGDDAANPRFIETAPKHGYRFIAPVEWAPRHAPARVERRRAEPGASWRQFLRLGGAGTAGGAAAGLIGGLSYGLLGATIAADPGVGAASALLVLVCITLLIGLVGGAGVAFGIAAAGLAPGGLGQWTVLGGALGGGAVGGFVKLLGLDAFHLLIGRTPGGITGAPEGALLGGAIGLSAWLLERGARPGSLGRSVAVAGMAGGAAGVLIHLIGGRLMAGSLDVLASAFPDSRLNLDPLGRLFGEGGFGPLSQTVVGGLEGALFGACVVGAMVPARRSGQTPDGPDLGGRPGPGHAGQPAARRYAARQRRGGTAQRMKLR